MLACQHIVLMNEIIKQFGKSFLDVLIQEITEQSGKWLIEQSKAYIQNTIEKGRTVANKGMKPDLTDAEYFTIAERRIAHAQQQLSFEVTRKCFYSLP